MTLSREEILKLFREMGKKGGSTTLARHGKEHYRKMIRKRWAKKRGITDLTEGKQSATMAKKGRKNN